MIDLWAYAIYDLRLSDAQFWRLTLFEFNLLSKRHNAEIKRQQYQTGLICAVIANSNRGKGKALKPEDFMPKEKKRQTINEMKRFLENLTVAFGGEVKC